MFKLPSRYVLGKSCTYVILQVHFFLLIEPEDDEDDDEQDEAEEVKSHKHHIKYHILKKNKVRKHKKKVSLGE